MSPRKKTAQPEVKAEATHDEIAVRAYEIHESGDGGDEVAFGYPWYRWMRATRWIPRASARAIFASAFCFRSRA